MMIEWKSFLLGDVIEYANGSSFPNRFQGLKQKRYDFYKVSDMNNPKNFMYMVEAENTVDDEIVEKLKAKVHPKDTVIFPKVGAALLTNKRRILSKPSLFDNNIMGIKPKKELLPLYLYYFMLTIDFAKYVQSGAVPSINKTIIDNIPINLPSLPEQRKIADILSSVDEAIEKTEAIIEQTEKVKKGLMQQLLTKGIGHTKFKKTEIGEIPEEWDIKRLEELSDRIFVGIATSTTEHYCETGIPIIRNQNIKENFLDSNDMMFITEHFDMENRNKKLKPGDILTVRTGYPGTSCVVPDSFEGAQTFTTLVTRPKHSIIDAEFLCRYINSHIGKKYVLGGQVGGAQKNLNVSVMAKLPVPVPPMNEQKKIRDILISFENKILYEKHQLKTLENLKKSLMQSLLTGKVRVKVDDEVMSS
ncbi:restriction endonuclease subunit S [Geobacillus thermodenitrificans]|uniref:restriction endonuclease subunit S n=1 Tax=Geobacillus thermodenitrificans TaxID=33940 RepID=UPI003D24F21F